MSENEVARKSQEREGDVDRRGKAGQQEDTWGCGTDGEKPGCQPTWWHEVGSRK